MPKILEGVEAMRTGCLVAPDPVDVSLGVMTGDRTGVALWIAAEDARDGFTVPLTPLQALRLSAALKAAAARAGREPGMVVYA